MQAESMSASEMAEMDRQDPIDQLSHRALTCVWGSVRQVDSPYGNVAASRRSP
jgi:hypothetical protein